MVEHRKIRIDQLLVERGFAETRARAQALVMAGLVYAGDRRVDKAGDKVAAGAAISVKGKDHPWVSRGGIKLQHGLDHFGIDPAGLVAIDVGASTGGFTDVLLSRGAARVYAVDVGHGQLDWKLRQDPRVEVRENVNARYLQPGDFAARFDLVVADVSFISLTKILPVVPGLVRAGAIVITLIKPQFEVGREEVGRGGIVRDEAAQQRVVAEVRQCAEGLGLAARGVIDSPILGADGNREFLACFEMIDQVGPGDFQAMRNGQD